MILDAVPGTYALARSTRSAAGLGRYTDGHAASSDGGEAAPPLINPAGQH